MYRQAVVLLLVLGLTSASEDDETRIFGGKSTTIEKHPYMVAIFEVDKFVCSGAIISESHVLVLGDEIYSVWNEDMIVVAGSSDAKVTSGVSFEIIKVVQHPGYNYSFSRFNWDFFIVFIKGKFTWGSTVAPAKLPTQHPSLGDEVTAVGYDKPEVGGMREGTMKWISQDACRSYYYPNSSPAEDKACVYNRGKTTLCLSDVGALIVKNNTLYAFYSRGLKDGYCTSSAKPSLTAYIVYVVDWIKKETGISK